MILSIDPGNIESAYVALDDNLKPIEFGKIYNSVLLPSLKAMSLKKTDSVVIEMIASYGMAVGAEVFETCVWIGKLTEAIENSKGITVKYIYRKDEKINLCGTMKAKDSNIRQALIDRFGVVGTKNNKGWFYGVSKDVWSAIAVGVTYSDMYLKGDK